MAKEIQTKNQLSRGKTLDGINFCINQEASLKAFLEDGDIPMDNNATESALRSFCLHKHAWKLIDSLDVQMPVPLSTASQKRQKLMI